MLEIELFSGNVRVLTRGRMIPYCYPDAANEVSDDICYSLDLFGVLAYALTHPFS
jgi:hypothetical protein